MEFSISICGILCKCNGVVVKSNRNQLDELDTSRMASESKSNVLLVCRR